MRTSTFLSACKERPLSVAVYYSLLIAGVVFCPRLSIGFALGFLFADYRQFRRSGVSVASYCDEDFFQRKEPKP